MPRHEIIMERIPKEHYEESADGALQMPTVAEYRSRFGYQVQCIICGEVIEVSGLDRVLATWDPDSIIEMSYHEIQMAGDPSEFNSKQDERLPKTDALPFLRAPAAKRNGAEDGGPSATGG